MEDEDDAPVPQSRAAFVTKFFNQVQLYGKLLLNYWWIPVLCVSVALGIQWLLLRHAPQAFVSGGRMIVNAKLSIPNANVYSEELNYFFGTQVALMQSDSVINRVNLRLRSDPNLHPVPVKIDVMLSPKTSIFNLAAIGGDPAYVQAYLQATMDEYIKLKKDLLATATTATQSSMEEELKQMAVALDKSKQEVLNYQSSNSVDGGKAAEEYLSALNRQLAERSSELRLLKTLTLDENLERMEGLFVQKDSGVSTNAPAPAGSAQASRPANAQDRSDLATPANLGAFEEAYLKAKQQIILLTTRRDDLAKFLAPDANDMVELNKEIALQEKLLQIYKEQSQEQLGNRQHTLELEIQDLSDQVKEWETKVSEVRKKNSDFDALKENHQRLQAMYDQMQANLQTLDVNKGIGQESVTILESAGPAVPVPLENHKHLLMAGLIGLVLGLGILLAINLLNDRPSSFTELEQLFDMPVLGQIPLVKSKGHPNGPIMELDDDRYPLIESYRSLRSALIYKDSIKGEPVNPAKSIVITSAGPADGKSTTSANFAITLAQAGSRVLLIDADLRRGVLHSFFGVEAGPGLAEVLAGKCPWTDAVVQTAVPNLSLLPRGVPPRHPGNLFAAPGRLLSAMAGQYDYYLFDSVPVMMADDVLSLAPHVDGLLLVIRAGCTSGRVAKAALDSLHQRRVNVIGLVFNAVHPRTSDYYNYRSKEYYAPQSPA